MATAVVTGASRGLGRALARSLVADGWTVVIDGRDGAALEEARAELAAAGPGRVRAVPGDVTDPGHRRAVVAEAAGTGRLDVLVNNAGALGPSPLPRLADLPPEGLAALFEVNVVAPLALVQEALPLLRRGAGRVLDVTSDAAVEAYEGWGGYGSSKAALEQLTAVLAAEEPGLRIYSVDPGDMRTRMHQDAFPGQDISDRPLPEEAVPGIRVLVDGDLPSGRYRSADLLEVAR